MKDKPLLATLVESSYREAAPTL